MRTIKVLGSGCPKCRQLAENVTLAVHQLGLQAEIVKVTSIQDIMKYGVMMTPGLVVDEQVKSVGKVLSVDEIRDLLA